MFIADKRTRRRSGRQSTKSIFIVHPYSQGNNNHRQRQCNDNIDRRQFIHNLLCEHHPLQLTTGTRTGVKDTGTVVINVRLSLFRGGGLGSRWDNCRRRDGSRFLAIDVAIFYAIPWEGSCVCLAGRWENQSRQVCETIAEGRKSWRSMWGTPLPVIFQERSGLSKAVIQGGLNGS
jgi:hypothetical protein